ncbi:MAG: hypothetical protein ACE5K0_10825 [Candidatus Methanofastidiosia archaeon]
MKKTLVFFICLGLMLGVQGISSDPSVPQQPTSFFKQLYHFVEIIERGIEEGEKVLIANPSAENKAYLAETKKELEKATEELTKMYIQEEEDKRTSEFTGNTYVIGQRFTLKQKNKFSEEELKENLRNFKLHIENARDWLDKLGVKIPPLFVTYAW